MRQARFELKYRPVDGHCEDAHAGPWRKYGVIQGRDNLNRFFKPSCSPKTVTARMNKNRAITMGDAIFIVCPLDGGAAND